MTFTTIRLNSTDWLIVQVSQEITLQQAQDILKAFKDSGIQNVVVIPHA